MALKQREVCIPKEVCGVFQVVLTPIFAFCQAYLDDRYLEKCLKALAKLCRKRPSPLLGGNPNTWAAGIVYFICAQNDRFVRGCPDRLDAGMVAGFFGLSASTASVKASQIRKLFHAQSYDERCWDLHTRLDPWRVPPSE